MTSGIRQDGQEIDFLPPFCHFSDLRYTDAATALSIFHAKEFLLLAPNFPKALCVDGDKISHWSLTGNIIGRLSLPVPACYFWTRGSTNADCFPILMRE